MPRKKNILPEDYNKPLPANLRELIRESGMSHEAIGNAIQKKRQSISAYADGSAAPHWETIVELANLFNVSTDFLLGKIAVRSPDMSVQVITEYTGISETAIERLKEISENGAHYIDALNMFLESEYLDSVLFYVSEFTDSTKMVWQLEKAKESVIKQLEDASSYVPNIALNENIHKAREQADLNEYRLFTNLREIIQEIKEKSTK